MRRGNVNASSKPVRNLWPYPGMESLPGTYETVRTNLAPNGGFEGSAGTPTVRTNICEYPNMATSGTTATLRTNYAQDPRMTTVHGTYNGTGTVTTVTGISGHPEGITTANRVSFSATDTNPGALVMIGPSSSTLYTVSAWVYGESGTMQLAIALKGQASSAQTVTTNGSWQKIVWTMTSAAGLVAGNDFGVRAAGTPGTTGSFLVTGIVVEQSGYSDIFFDGATSASSDFTYAWIGTANNSASVQKAPPITGWALRWFGSTGGTGVTWKSTDTPYDGAFLRKLWLTANTGASQDVGINNTTRIGVSPNAIYTASIMARCSVITQRMSIVAAWYDSGGTLISQTTNTDLGSLSASWQRFSYTLPAAPANAATATFIFGPYTNAVAMPAGATLDFDQCIIEATTVAGAYFDGATAASGDYTYVWASTANSSASIQRGVGISGTMYNNGVAGAYQSAVWKDTASNKSMRLTPVSTTSSSTYASPEGDAGGGFKFGMVAGNTYTASATCHIEAAQTGTLHANARQLVFYYKDGAGNYQTVVSAQMPNVANTTQRLSATCTIPVGATEAFVRLYNGAAAGCGDVWWDNELVELSSIAGTYFDGSTSASGDFTFAWNGTTNASTSIQKGLKVSGWASNSNGSNRFVGIASTQWRSSGTYSLRIIPLQSTDGTLGATYAEQTLTNLTIGQRYRVAITGRLAAPLAGSVDANSRKVAFTNPTPSAISQNPSTPANTTGVFRTYCDFTATNTSHGIRWYNGAREGNGDMWFDDMILTEGPYAGDHIDGTKPFAKWDGAANASTSVGYPPQLYDIAGKPDVDLTGIASTGGVAIPVNATGPRTIYACYESYGNTQNYQNWLSYGLAGSKGFMLQTAAAGSNSMACRFDMPGGSSNGAIVLGNGRTVQRHVTGIAFNNGLTNATSTIDGAADTTTALVPGTGWDDGRCATLSSSEGTAIRALVFYSEHDRATRVAISRYLGTKYGAYVA